MKKALLFAVVFSFAAGSLLADDSQFRPSVMKRCSAEKQQRYDAAVASASASQPLTLSAAIDKKVRDYRDMWLTGKDGKKIRASCNFQCTQFCNSERNECVSNGTPSEYCCWAWIDCMCTFSCCTVSCDAYTC